MEAHLTVEEGPARGERVVVVEGQTCVLGRGPGATFVLPAEALAPRHAALLVGADGVKVVDLAGGARLDGKPLAMRAAVGVEAGAELTLGPCIIRVEVHGAPTASPIVSKAASFLAAPHLPADLRLVRFIGEGANGHVAHAVRQSDGRPVAVKILREELRPGTPAHARFVREASLMTRLRSPHVVAILEARLELPRPIIVMELVQGPSARDLVDKGPLPVGKALLVAADVARALAAAAGAGVVHRDVKPGNVIVPGAPPAFAKLVDFGMAKDLDGVMATLTASGAGLGTLAYLAPEQLDAAKHVDPLADVYGLGATLYHLIAGRAPFLTRAATDLVALVREPPPPLAQLRPDVPPEVAQVVHALLEKEPSRRPPAFRVADRLAALAAAAPRA